MKCVCIHFLKKKKNRRCYLLLESGLHGDIRSRIPRNKNESAEDEYKFDTAKTVHEKSTQNIRVCCKYNFHDTLEH